MKKLVILGVTIYSFAQLTNAATLNVKPYSTTQDGQKVELYTMSNNKGVRNHPRTWPNKTPAARGSVGAMRRANA